MKEYEIDVEKFRTDPDCSIVVSFMLALNDIERIADLRDVHCKNPRGYKSGQFELSIGGYTANVLIAHVYEAYFVLRKITASRNIHTVIESDPDLKCSFEKARKRVDDTKDQATGESAYDSLLRKWKNLRNYIIFHYNPDEDKIPDALQKIGTHYKTSVSYIGGTHGEPTFHELAHEVTDAVAADTLGYTFPNSDQQIIDKLVADVQPLIQDFRFFAHKLVLKYLDMYKAN